MNFRRPRELFILLSLLGPALLAAQVPVEPRARMIDPGGPLANIRVDKNLVLVPVTVFDPFNRLITGLEREQFRVFDEKVEQTVSTFSVDDAPLALGLVFDISGSMGGKLRRSRKAADAFFRGANPEDEFFLVEFNQRPSLSVPLTTDPRHIHNRLASVESKGGTALLDALHLSLQEIQRSNKPRKALLVISDGGDNRSRHSESELRNLVRETDVLIYAIGIFEPYASRGRTPEEFAGPVLLKDIAEQTGGREYPAQTLKELPDIANRIAVELRHRYVLGFSPTSHQRDGRYHRVQVSVVPPRGLPPLRASWRLGYYAPSE